MKVVDLTDKIFSLKDQYEFTQTALTIFRYQAERNTIYNHFVKSLGKNPSEINCIEDIPFLPVDFFRSQKILTGEIEYEMVFESSATTGSIPSRHYVHDISLYEKSFISAFNLFYGNPSEYLITALLPSYVERENSSLVYMVNKLIEASGNLHSGFYKNNHTILIDNLRKAVAENRKAILIGVSFALLDFAETYRPDLYGTIIMETGGMKGRRKEITRMELHEILKEQLNVPVIHSEYGMTELLSQAYSKGAGTFYTPPWMKVLVRDPQDPVSIFTEFNATGGLNIIDLANIHSCSFIATSDLGKLHVDSGFEVLGRFDSTEIRGCNLMAE